MLTAIYGGAFDPVHNGHLAVARAAAAALDARVFLLPTGDPRHRPPAHASAVHRVAMLRLALADAPMLSLDTCEIERDGPSYSVDTLAELRAEHGPDAPLAMIVGADSFLGLASWHRWRELFTLAHIVVAERPGATLDTIGNPDLADTTARRWTQNPRTLHAAPAGRILRLSLPLQPESSSAIRTACATGQPIDRHVPPAVARYIAAHALYR